MVDEQDDPVAGAIVFVDSRPPRRVRAGDDGVFVFQELIGRRYTVRARAGQRIGGPVARILTEQSEPLVIRISPAAGLRVVVIIDRASGEPPPRRHGRERWRALCDHWIRWRRRACRSGGLGDTPGLQVRLRPRLRVRECPV